ncbi:N-6 DNA methylase [Curtobacterium sp. A7_M15]|uniref:N-6 DNA methylase n=1 Tax=Curtobacterium sp. A7_M15 TaxID=3065241 RepID=UPI00273791CA|nr:N-6 DNA methylase [Curtobacterium sp. A7_M15]MDP4332133.1 N-6 DNA methylase [Curtobacterium sp. A7_M15]
MAASSPPMTAPAALEDHPCCEVSTGPGPVMSDTAKPGRLAESVRRKADSLELMIDASASAPDGKLRIVLDLKPSLPQASLKDPPVGGRSSRPPLAGQFSARRVHRAIEALQADTRRRLESNWLAAVCAFASEARPDLEKAFEIFLGRTRSSSNYLRGMTVGEIGVVYEALLASLGRSERKASGQYFTPDDAAAFMAAQSRTFPDEGVWLDPCTGVGNLAWHLAAAQADPASFVKHRLTLIDLDRTALLTAVVILVSTFAEENDHTALKAVWGRSRVRDFLSDEALPPHDFVIVNPPYARSPRRTGFRTAAANELFAYFTERVASTSRGFIAVTPAAYLNAPRYQVLRDHLDETQTGGCVFVFDNVPDTLFRGYKYGSTNTSKTNFVRAAITVCTPQSGEWQITPILRWAAGSRSRMFLEAHKHLVKRRIGPDGQWAKVMRGTEQLWQYLEGAPHSLSDLLVKGPTEYRLEVASTPRYYISASLRPLDRTSKHILFFADAESRDRAYLLINSSVSYWWWRVIDGGVTLPLRALRSMPMPDFAPDDSLIARLRHSETTDVVLKLNAGRHNENVKRSPALVEAVNRCVLGGAHGSFREVYAPDLFAG